MKKIIERFSEKTRHEKCAFLVGTFSSIIVIVCAVLQITGAWDGAIVVCEIFMGISMISQAILQWKKNRGIAVFSLCVAAFIFAVAFFVLFVR